MKSIEWQAFGFSEVESERLAGLRRDDDSFTLGCEFALWEQWVRELDRGACWTSEELEAASSARDELDASIAQLLSVDQQSRLFAHLDDLDRTFRDRTVQGLAIDGGNRANWWRNRIPISNRQRHYLFDDR